MQILLNLQSEIKRKGSTAIRQSPIYYILIFYQYHMQNAKEQLHQVWLQCMQMSQCSPEAAKNFVSQVKHVIDTPLTHSGQTLLMLSSSIGSLNLVVAILQHKPNIKLKDNIGRNALHYAAAVGNIQIFEILIKCGAQPKELTIGGQSPLSKACLFAQGDIIQWYLNNCLQAFNIGDRLNKKPLDHLKSSGQSLYEQVKEVYQQLSNNQMKQQ